MSKATRGRGKLRGRGRGKKALERSETSSKQEDESWTISMDQSRPSEMDKSLRSVQRICPVIKLKPGKDEKEDLFDLWDDPEDDCDQQVNLEIRKMFQSFFRVRDIPSSVISTAKRLLIQQITKLMSEVVRRHVITKNKTNNLHLFEVLKVIETFGDNYKHKIARTFMMEALEGKKSKKNINLNQVSK